MDYELLEKSNKRYAEFIKGDVPQGIHPKFAYTIRDLTPEEQAKKAVIFNLAPSELMGLRLQALDYTIVAEGEIFASRTATCDELTGITRRIGRILNEVKHGRMKLTEEEIGKQAFLIAWKIETPSEPIKRGKDGLYLRVGSGSFP